MSKLGNFKQISSVSVQSNKEVVEIKSIVCHLLIDNNPIKIFSRIF